VAVVVSAAFLSSAAAVMVGNLEGSNARAEDNVTNAAGPNAYFVDTLFRSSRAGQENTSQAEAARIFTNALRQNQMPAPDQGYLAQLVGRRPE
jgi:hypothetical protein